MANKMWDLKSHGIMLLLPVSTVICNGDFSRFECRCCLTADSIAFTILFVGVAIILVEDLSLKQWNTGTGMSSDEWQNWFQRMTFHLSNNYDVLQKIQTKPDGSLVIEGDCDKAGAPYSPLSKNLFASPGASSELVRMDESPLDVVSLINNQALAVRTAANNANTAEVLLCLVIAAIIRYRERSQNEWCAPLADHDTKFYTNHLKPILEFILFIKHYFHSSSPSTYVLEQWKKKNVSNRNLLISVDGSVGVTKKEVKLDSCRKYISVNLLPNYEKQIDFFLQGLMTSTIQLGGNVRAIYSCFDLNESMM
jgi:hypothetical protein